MGEKKGLNSGVSMQTCTSQDNCI